MPEGEHEVVLTLCFGFHESKPPAAGCAVTALSNDQMFLALDDADWTSIGGRRSFLRGGTTNVVPRAVFIVRCCTVGTVKKT